MTALYSAETENWRPIPSAPGYDVSDQGRVRSWRVQGSRTSRRESPQLKAQVVNTTGYLYVSLGVAGRQVSRKVHTLVLEAFVGPHYGPDGGRSCRACRPFRTRPDIADDPNDQRHGTPYGYTGCKCRCERCTAANTVASRARAAKSREAKR